MNLEHSHFGTLPDGRRVTLFTLTNANGMRVRLIDFGAITVSVETRDRLGRSADVTLGYDTLDGYLTNKPYLGATVGRCGSRIANGRFTLEGKDYTLSINDGRHHLHGGARGFNRVLWTGEPVRSPQGVGVKFTYVSSDGEEGYPGTLTATAVHTLTDQNEFRIEYTATTNRPTIVNLVHHSYWNLSGGASPDILGHVVHIPAPQYVASDAELIANGEILPVSGTPLDFNRPTSVGERIAQVAGGYDLTYVLPEHGKAVVAAADVYEPTSGRVLEILTDQPGIQFYSGNFLDGTLCGKGGTPYRKYAGLCLETQHFPNSPNHPEFPSVVLRAGERYRHAMVHRFAVR